MSSNFRGILLSCAIALGVAGALSAQSPGNYTYDDSGNITSIGPDTTGLTNFYDYDSANRLIRFVRKNATTGTVSLTETYEYDAYGNLTKQTSNGVATTLAADVSTNRLTSATYDAAGNMTQYGGETYTFDPVGTMTRKSGSWGSALYIYTADGERIGVEGPDGTWKYMGRGLDGEVLREWSAPSWNGTWSWVEDYVYRDRELAAAVRPAAQGGTRHFHLDHLGSPLLITAADKTVYAEHAYNPYGRERTSPTQEPDRGFDTPEPMKFTGHERDFAGSYTGPVLDYMHARYYNPASGRFLSVDPMLDVKVALRSPQMWNRYAYVLNNPMRYIDPDGRYIRLVGTKEEQEKVLELIRQNLPPADRKRVTLGENGMLKVDGSSSSASLAFSNLKQAAGHKTKTIEVRLAKTAIVKAASGPGRPLEVDLQAGGGGLTVNATRTMSNHIEVTVDPRGNPDGEPLFIVMGHELLGHGWDYMFKGKSTEQTAIKTENAIRKSLKLPLRPNPRQ